MTERRPRRPVILVVEDAQPNRELLVRRLSAHGYHVESACDGEAALRTLEETRPDLVLLEVKLPGIGGFDVCRAIKRRPATRLTPVVLVTGLNDRPHKIKGIEVGADDFFSKPFDQEDLLAQIVGIVDTFDANTTTRPYWTALPADHAYEELTREATLGLHRDAFVQEFVALGRAGTLATSAAAVRSRATTVTSRFKP